MTHECCETRECRALHLEVRDAALAKAERLNLLVKFDVVWLEAHPAALRRIEAWGSDGDTLACGVRKEFAKLLVGIYEVGGGKLLIPCRMLRECLLKREVTYAITAGVVRKQTIEAERCAGEDYLTHLYILLYSARSTEAHEGQLTELLLYLSSLEVDVCKSIELRDADVDITDADTR